MAHLFSILDRDNLNDIFLRAFQDCTKGIIDSLSTGVNDPAIATTIQTIVVQLNYDYNRLIYVVDIIQARVYRDAMWVDTAITVYDLIATFIDPYFPHPSLPVRGPLLVQHQLMKALQAQFTVMLQDDEWSAGFVHFLGQLGTSSNSIGALTPGIVLHILTGMIDSTNIFGGQNFDLLFDFVIAVGPFLDTQALDVVNQFGEKLQLLQERVKSRGSVLSVAVFGLLKLRESGWRAEDSNLLS